MERNMALAYRRNQTISSLRTTDIMDKMDSTEVTLDYMSSLPPCQRSNANITQKCTEEEREPEWLENEVAGIRIWQLVGMILSVILAIIIMVCCCVRFRIPRTKQEIEADYIRKKLTRSFRKELAKINDKEMDEMDLSIALDRVREIFSAAETHETESQDKIIYSNANQGFKTKFNTIFNSIRIRFNKNEATEINTMI